VKVKTVSFSSDRKLVRCEQQYSYRYDEGLKPRVKSKGLYMGAVLHDLIETHRRKGDWKKVFASFQKQWNSLFDEEREMYEEKGMTPEHVKNLFTHYTEHWADEDAEWKPLFVEQEFRLPTKYGITIIFKADYIAQRKGVIALFENKNKGDIPESEERMLAPQPHSYAFLLSKLPQPVHVSKVIWDYIRTEKVPSPQLLKNGTISKRKINTDQRTYLKFLKESGIQLQGDEAIGVQKYVDSLPETLTLARVSNSVNLKVGEMFVRDWIRRALRAREIDKPTRNWSRDCRWICDYRKLCMADMLGTPDRNTIISRDFVTHIKKAGE
jgi:hypothetical protein